MKAVVIGGSGHFHLLRQAMDAGYPVELLALAPGRPEEDLSAVEEAFPDVRQVRDWRETLSMGAELAVVNPWFCDAGEIAAVCLEACIAKSPCPPPGRGWSGWKGPGRIPERPWAACSIIAMPPGFWPWSRRFCRGKSAKFARFTHRRAIAWVRGRTFTGTGIPSGD